MGFSTALRDLFSGYDCYGGYGRLNYGFSDNLPFKRVPSARFARDKPPFFDQDFG
jgi:hypothetical protein